MRIPRAWWIAFLLGGLIGAGVSVRLASRPMRSAAPAEAAPLSESRRSAIVTAAQRVSPAVVSVSVEGTQVVNTNPFGNMFHDEYFDRFFLQEQQVRSLGSGVIVDGSGLVVSNEHVVRNADSVKVTLADGRHFAATVIAATPVYDLSVLRIPADHLPTAPLGNSSELVVGEWAIAVGNPFGYLINDPQPTVTAGVISATHRDIQSGATGGGVYKDMIQTDAAINPGNSGGALANRRLDRPRVRDSGQPGEAGDRRGPEVRPHPRAVARVHGAAGDAVDRPAARVHRPRRAGDHPGRGLGTRGACRDPGRRPNPQGQRPRHRFDRRCLAQHLRRLGR